MQIGLHKNQMTFFRAMEKYVLYSGGIGSGKTFVGALWAVTQAINFPGVAGIITANTHSQLQKSTLPLVFDILKMFKLNYTYLSNKGVIKIGRTVIYCVSMEKYDNIRGINAGWAWSDECAYGDEAAFLVLIGRLRDKNGPCQWRGTTTPKGFNWVYNRFYKDPMPNSRIIFGSSNDNKANLGESYIDDLKHNYDGRLAAQELEGQFINSNSGLVYHAFSRQINSAKTNDLEKVLYLGLDFNVNPLCGAFCYESNSGLYVTKELRLENSNTFRATKEIAKMYPEWRLKVVPDETGNRRKTSASKTDHEILKEARLHLEPFKNPLAKDRQNNINRLLYQQRLFVDVDNCPHLVTDLETLTHDNKDEKLGHLGDCIGYVAWHLYPFQKPRRKGSVHYL